MILKIMIILNKLAGIRQINLYVLLFLFEKDIFNHSIKIIRIMRPIYQKNAFSSPIVINWPYCLNDCNTIMKGLFLKIIRNYRIICLISADLFYFIILFFTSKKLNYWIMISRFGQI